MPNKAKTITFGELRLPRSKKSRKKSKFPTQDELFRLEVAAEMGLLEKVQQCGWDGLSAEETGRLGGLITKRKRARNNA